VFLSSQSHTGQAASGIADVSAASLGAAASCELPGASGVGDGAARRPGVAGPLRRGGELPWMRFTPGHINDAKCLARTWSDGTGLQCDNYPIEGRLVCKRHSKSCFHGLVTGAIPPLKLKEFEKKAASNRVGAEKLGGGAQKTGPKTMKQKFFWYSRHRMWAAAKELDNELRLHDKGTTLDGIDQLNGYEFNLCLKKVHAYHAKYSATTEGVLERSKGVRNFAEYVAKPEDADYNGIGGGRVFQWYRRPVFEMFLRTSSPIWQGPPRAVHEGVTEKQCMRALVLTSVHLSKFSTACEYLTPYAGPQCFPHLQDVERREANGLDRLLVSAGGAVSADGLFQGCAWDRWRRCDGCRRWRLLDPEAVEVFGEEGCDKRLPHRLIDWRAWLLSAPERFAQFQQEHDPRGATLGGKIEMEIEREGAEELAAFGIDAPEEDVQSAASGGVSVVESSLSGQSASTASLDFAEILRDLGGRGGGLNEEESHEAKSLERGASALRKGPVASLPAVGRGSESTPGPRVEFRCDMLLRRDTSASATGSWRPMSCEDEDDFVAWRENLLASESDSRFHYSKGDEVWVLTAEAGVDPMGPDAYLRPAVVTDLLLVDVDERLQ
jgi:hypothetical protein